MSARLLAASLAALAVTTLSSYAAQSSLQLQLSTEADFERRSMAYDCGTETPLAVSYLNAAPNFLAVLTPPDATEALVFASVLSASGARYAAGQWVWWTDGLEASLYDQTLGEDADPVLTCSEVINTP